MRSVLVFAAVGLLLHCSLVEGTTTPDPTTSGTGGTVAPEGTATSCYACTADVNNTADACFGAQSGGGDPCAIGVCIVTLVDNAAGDPVSFVRECHATGCSTENDNSVSTQTAGGQTTYQKCCDDTADCNTFSADDLRSAAGKLTAGLAAILFGAICLLVL